MCRCEGRRPTIDAVRQKRNWLYIFQSNLSHLLSCRTPTWTSHLPHANQNQLSAKAAILPFRPSCTVLGRVNYDIHVRDWIEWLRCPPPFRLRQGRTHPTCREVQFPSAPPGTVFQALQPGRRKNGFALGQETLSESLPVLDIDTSLQSSPLHRPEQHKLEVLAYTKNPVYRRLPLHTHIRC